MTLTATDPLWTSNDVRDALDATVSGTWQCWGLSIDSRSVERDDMFFALSGPNFDGHNYVQDALNKGAVAAVVEREIDGIDNNQLVIVKDVRQAMVDLGQAARNRVSIPIVALTGSVGKTSTKEALWASLGRYRKTHASVSSFNNDIGVPLSLARMPADCEFAVFELGMNHAGEIRDLVAQVRPNVAIVTNVELAHSEFFDSAEGIADAKAEIFEGLTGDMVAILNIDNAHYERLKDHATRCGAKKFITFGMEDNADVYPSQYVLHDDCCCVNAHVGPKNMTYKIGQPGLHWVMNSLAVLAAVDQVGGDLGLAGLALAEISPLPGRGQRRRIYFDEGSDVNFLLIDESYNANPASMKASLETLGATTVKGRGLKIAALGDMAELGDDADLLHASLGQYILANGIDRVYLTGEHMKALSRQLPADVLAGHYHDTDDLYQAVRSDLKHNDVIMVKGSRSTGMNRLVDDLKELDHSQYKQVG